MPHHCVLNLVVPRNNLDNDQALESVKNLYALVEAEKAFLIHGHDPDQWEAAGRPDVMQEARGAVDRILSTHQPLPFDEEIDGELDRIKKKAEDSLV